MSEKNNKFLFDLHDFEKEIDEEKESRKVKAPPPPSFSLEDMEAARHVAFEKGKDEGLELAKNSIEQQTELLIQNLAEQIQTLENAEAARQQAYLTHTVAMAYKSLEKILPQILDHTKEELIKTALTEFFNDNSMKGALKLYVHSSMIESVERYAQSLNSNLVLASDDKLSSSQARIEWDNGAFEFKPDQLMEQILQTIKRRADDNDQILDEAQKKPHTDEETPT